VEDGQILKGHKGEDSGREDPFQLVKTASELDPLALYLKQISRYSLLTAEQEQTIGREIEKCRLLLQRLAKRHRKGTIREKLYRAKREKLESRLVKAKYRMINGNVRLVVAIAKKFQYRGLALLDLIDEGNIGLIEAVERFDYRRGCRFTTYGTWWIKQAIIKALADKGRMIRIPIHMLNTIKKCYIVAKHLTQELGRNPSAEELARYMHTDVKKIILVHKLSQETTSLDLPVDADQSTKLVDLIGDRQWDEPFETVFHLTLQDTLQRVLHKLSAREMKIITLRFGLGCDGPHSLEETGKLLGITRERVRQIQEKAIMKLKDSRQILELWDNWQV
jgi:RNA polymerase primary sigma factor